MDTLPMPSDVTLQISPNGPTIATRIYRSRSLSAVKPTHPQKTALIAHPYAALGGSYDDSTVLLIVSTLLSAGYSHIGTFNFRRPSWTLKPEIEDATAFAVFSMGVCMRDYGLDEDSGCGKGRLHVTIAGYSYGAFVAGQVPCASDMLARMSAEVRAHLLRQVDLALFGTATAPSAKADGGADALAGLKITTSYLLMSPLLAPVTRLLAPLNRCDSLVGRAPGSMAPCDALAVFGTEDVFTSSKRLVQWAGKHGIEAEVVDGADHFWQDSRHKAQLQDSIREWVVRHEDG